MDTGRMNTGQMDTGHANAWGLASRQTHLELTNAFQMYPKQPKFDQMPT